MTGAQGFARFLSQFGWVAFILGLCVAMNLGAAFLPIRPALVSAFQTGAIAGRTPPEVSDWWHVTRAQSDCRAMQPVLGIDEKRWDEAFNRRYLSDRQGKSTDCELLGGFLADPNNARIGQSFKATGLNSAGAVAAVIVSAVGWKGAQIGHFVLIIATWMATLCLWHRRRLASWRIIPSTALAIVLLLLAVPGAVTLLPLSILLLAIASAPVLRRDPDWWRQHSGETFILAAAICWPLDPQAGSSAAVLAILLGILPLCLEDVKPAVLGRLALKFVATTMGMMLLYVTLAVLAAGARDLSWQKALVQTFGDTSQTGSWSVEFFGALENFGDWLASGILGFDLTVTILVWSIPFALLSGLLARGVRASSRSAVYRYALAALSPLLVCVAWTAAYPGLLRRGVDSYVLLVVVPLAIGLWRLSIAGLGFIDRISASDTGVAALDAAPSGA